MITRQCSRAVMAVELFGKGLIVRKAETTATRSQVMAAWRRRSPITRCVRASHGASPMTNASSNKLQLRTAFGTHHREGAFEGAFIAIGGCARQASCPDRAGCTYLLYSKYVQPVGGLTPANPQYTISLIGKPVQRKTILWHAVTYVSWPLTYI